MKTQLPYKIAVLLVMIPALVLANHDKLKGKHTKEKVIKKEYSVDANATLKVDNSYGNIDINTWEGNTISIQVTIKTNGNNEEKVQKKLDNIDVDFSASSSYVSAETKFNSRKSNSWWKWGNNNKVNMQIDYLIRLPITNNVDLDNDYGSIDIETLEGKAKISCDYGKITTQELKAEGNELTFDYTNNCYFEFIQSGTINADYSGFTVVKTKNLDISADYSKSVVDVAEDINYNCDYGSIKVSNVNSFKGTGDYLSTRLGTVYKNVDISADYGSIKIERIASNAHDVTIKSDYAGITIGYDAAYSFNFDIELGYASLKHEDGFEFNKKRIESSEKYYQGYHGKADSGNMVKIESDYGSVNFKLAN